MEKLIGSFYAVSASGESITLCVYQDVIPAGSFGDPHATVLGLKRIEDEEGRAVNYCGNGEYEIVSLGLKLRGPLIN